MESQKKPKETPLPLDTLFFFINDQSKWHFLLSPFSATLLKKKTLPPFFFYSTLFLLFQFFLLTSSHSKKSFVVPFFMAIYSHMLSVKCVEFGCQKHGVCRRRSSWLGYGLLRTWLRMEQLALVACHGWVSLHERLLAELEHGLEQAWRHGHACWQCWPCWHARRKKERPNGLVLSAGKERGRGFGWAWILGLLDGLKWA